MIFTQIQFKKNRCRILQLRSHWAKVGEEGVETALAATVNDREELTNEASDLMYHLLVLLQDQELDLGAVIENLRGRHK